MVELELADWKNLEENLRQSIRVGKVNLINDELVLANCRREIEKLEKKK